MMRITLAILLVFAVLGSAGCGRKKAAPPSQPGSEVKRLRIYCWPDYIPQRILNRFTLETGIRITTDTYTSHDEMIANVRSQQAEYDLIQQGEAALDALILRELLLPLDKANIPVNAQIPITVAANICGVSINILSVSTGGQANCTATTTSPELAQVVQQQIAAGGSVGGGAQGDSTSATSGTTATSPAPTATPSTPATTDTSTQQ